MNTITLCVYGEFEKKDIRVKLFSSSGTQQFEFQNVLIDAGYDAKLFTLPDGDPVIGDCEVCKI